MCEYNESFEVREFAERQFFLRTVREEVRAILDHEAGGDRQRLQGWHGTFYGWRQIPTVDSGLVTRSWSLCERVRFIRGSGDAGAIGEMRDVLSDRRYIDLSPCDLAHFLDRPVRRALCSAVQEELLLRGIDPERMDEFAVWAKQADVSEDRRRALFRRYVLDNEDVEEIASTSCE